MTWSGVGGGCLPLDRTPPPPGQDHTPLSGQDHLPRTGPPPQDHLPPRQDHHPGQDHHPPDRTTTQLDRTTSPTPRKDRSLTSTPTPTPHIRTLRSMHRWAVRILECIPVFLIFTKLSLMSQITHMYIIKLILFHNFNLSIRQVNAKSLCPGAK